MLQAVEGSCLLALAAGARLDVVAYCLLTPYLNGLSKQMTAWFLVFTAVDRFVKVAMATFLSNHCVFCTMSNP